MDIFATLSSVAGEPLKLLIEQKSKESNIFDFLISLAPVLAVISSIIAIIISSIQNKRLFNAQDKRELIRIRQEGITKNRVEWINSVRDNVAEIVSSDINVNNSTILQKAYILKLCLNVLGPFDGVIVHYLNKLINSRHTKNEEEFMRYKRLLTLAVQVYLKAEWNRVRWESNASADETWDEEKSLKEILGKFSKDSYINDIAKEYKKLLSNNQIITQYFTEIIYLEPQSSVMHMSASLNTIVEKGVPSSEE